MFYKPKKILIVDDSRSFITYISLLLRKMGFGKIVIAENGVEALRLLKMWQPDVAILDITMPDMDGIETLRRMKAKKETADIPVIILTANHDEKTYMKCQAIGSAGYMIKPLKLPALNDLLQECITASGGSRRFHLRTPYAGKVSVTHGESTEALPAVTLSEGGIFLKTADPLPPGAEVEVSFALDKGETLRLRGEVIYQKDPMENSPHSPPGMAVEFKGLKKRESGMLTDYITGLITGSSRHAAL